MMRALVFLAAVLLSSAAASAQNDGLGQLDRLVGTWQGSGAFVDSAYSKAGSAQAMTTCAWSTDRLFLICQQSVSLSGKSDDDVAIYTYDSAAAKYHFYNVGVARFGNTDIRVRGNTIEYDGSFTDGAKHVLTRTLNVWESPQRYSWRAEYSVDGGAHWTLMGSGASTRVSS
ncbi:MAG: hypothetical protein JOY69_11280 [Candidatus Eremiobacteraeota bacterium]|nr:hypothetical protein [Candidatus Eremiobacteraeota bacterium]MBV8373832.1 hypothetical protein [Candidatus Eremiobacteraeota bacterium]